MNAPTGLCARTGLLVALLAVLVGCGGQEPMVPPEAAPWRDCGSGDFVQASGQVARVPTEDGQGSITVKLVKDGPCAGLVTFDGARVQGSEVSGLDLDRDTAQVVEVGGQPILRLDSAAHPRGGYQPHLFALGEDVAELTVDGHPLLPFVATDGGAAPMAARCGRQGTVEVLTATTSEPPGVVLAWDVHRTTYEVDGSHATEIGSEQVRDHAADPLLHAQLPELFEPGGLLGNCAD